ncbi:MAG: hypothetical protein AAF533_16865 [Acidobacteriota bacterium]
MALSCPNCHFDLPDPPGGVCPTCGQILSTPAEETAPQLPPPQPPPTPPPSDSPYAAPPSAGVAAASEVFGSDSVDPSAIPWENPDLGLKRRFVDTVKLFFSRPGWAFANVPRADITAPLTYGWLVAALGILIIWAQIAIILGGGMLLSGEGLPMEILLMGGAYIGFNVLWSAGTSVVSLFILSAFHALGLLVFGGQRRGFPVTFRVTCYSQTMQLLMLIPVLGWLGALLLVPGMQVYGAAKAHDIPIWKSLLAYFLPPLLCFGILFLPFFLVIMSEGMALD